MQTPYADRLVHPHERAIDPLRDTGVGRTSASASALDALALDRRFLSLLQSFRPSGGVSGAQGVADLLFTRSGQHVGRLARWIVRGEVVHFDWQHDTWLPMFQFDLATMTPHPSVAGVLKELAGVFDPWETAQWFASPCLALLGRTPASAVAGALPSDAQAVLQAARYDRFVADA